MGPRFCETPIQRPRLKENSIQSAASWGMAGEFRQDFQDRPLVEAQGHDETL